ncbi:MAG: hypothetical protein ACFCVK_05980 [Acidimicrobiales bacterium]
MKSVEPGEALDTADDILSRPEYVERPPTLVDRALDWLLDRFADLFGAVLGVGGGFVIGYAVLAVALGAAAWFLIRVLPRRRPAATVDGAGVRHMVDEVPSRRQWLERAAEAERRGDWDAAVHARYHALTTGLAAGDLVPAASSTTSGEHRRAYAVTVADRERVARFDDAVDRFEHVWFGGVDAERPDSDALRRTDDELLG